MLPLPRSLTTWRATCSPCKKLKAPSTKTTTATTNLIERRLRCFGPIMNTLARRRRRRSSAALVSASVTTSAHSLSASAAAAAAVGGSHHFCFSLLISFCGALKPDVSFRLCTLIRSRAHSHTHKRTSAHIYYTHTHIYTYFVCCAVCALLLSVRLNNTPQKAKQNYIK